MFQKSCNPTWIDLIVISKPGIFRNAKIYEIAVSDLHKLVVSIMKLK